MDQLISKEDYIVLLERKTRELTEENSKLKEQLKKYTNPDRVKKYQEKNKEVISEQKRQAYQKKQQQCVHNSEIISLRKLLDCHDKKTNI